MKITVQGDQANISLAETELLVLAAICRIAADNLNNFDDTNLRNYALRLNEKLINAREAANKLNWMDGM